MPNCQKCQFDYFCCKLRVKTTFWERLKIHLTGRINFIEKDYKKRKIIKFKNNQCIFLKNKDVKFTKSDLNPAENFLLSKTVKKIKNIIKIKEKQPIYQNNNKKSYI